MIEISNGIKFLILVLFSYSSVMVLFLLGLQAYLIFSLPIIMVTLLLRILQIIKRRSNKKCQEKMIEKKKITKKRTNH